MIISRYKIRCAAIILISSGNGWAGGHYIPADSLIIAYSFQFIVIVLLLIFGIHFLSKSKDEYKKNRWSTNGMTIISALSLLKYIEYNTCSV